MLDARIVMMLAVGTLLLVSGIFDLSRRRATAAGETAAHRLDGDPDGDADGEDRPS
jgi:hypothetical protein